MPSCSICIDDLKKPVALPCGHVFCSNCVYRAVSAIKPYATLHYCPTCRTPYTTVNMDTALIPDHLRPHVVPHIRRLYLDEPNPATSNNNMAAPSASAECARLNAENASLRFNCDLWRKRAEVHAAATLGLLNIARVARDHALQLKQEKEDLQRKYNILKRKVDADDLFTSYSSGPPSSRTSSTTTTPDYSCPPASRQFMEIPHTRSRPVSDIRISSSSNQSQTVSCSAWTDIAKNIKQEEDAHLPKRRRTEAYNASRPSHMVAQHNVDVDMLVPSLSRRKTPSPSMASS